MILKKTTFKMQEIAFLKTTTILDKIIIETLENIHRRVVKS